MCAGPHLADWGSDRGATAAAGFPARLSSQHPAAVLGQFQDSRTSRGWQADFSPACRGVPRGADVTFAVSGGSANRRLGLDGGGVLAEGWRGAVRGALALGCVGLASR